MWSCIQEIYNPMKEMGLKQICTHLAIMKGLMGYTPKERKCIGHWLRIQSLKLEGHEVRSQVCDLLAVGLWASNLIFLASLFSSVKWK